MVRSVVVRKVQCGDPQWPDILPYPICETRTCFPCVTHAPCLGLRLVTSLLRELAGPRPVCSALTSAEGRDCRVHTTQEVNVPFKVAFHVPVHGHSNCPILFMRRSLLSNYTLAKLLATITDLLPPVLFACSTLSLDELLNECDFNNDVSNAQNLVITYLRAVLDQGRNKHGQRYDNAVVSSLLSELAKYRTQPEEDLNWLPRLKELLKQLLQSGAAAPELIAERFGGEIACLLVEAFERATKAHLQQQQQLIYQTSSTPQKTIPEFCAELFLDYDFILGTSGGLVRDTSDSIDVVPTYSPGRGSGGGFTHDFSLGSAAAHIVKSGGKQLFVQITETNEYFPLKYMHVLNGKERIRTTGKRKSPESSEEGTPSPRAVQQAAGGRMRFWVVAYDPVDRVKGAPGDGCSLYALSQGCFVTQKEGRRGKAQQGVQGQAAPRYQVLANAVVTRRACDQGR